MIMCICVWYCLSWVKYLIRVNYYHTTRNGCRILPGMYQRRTAVWEGRGATARPSEAKWSSGVAAVCWGVLQQNCFQRYWIWAFCCLFVVRICICSGGDAELPVVLLYLLHCLVYHMLSKTRRNCGSLRRVIGEVFMLGLLVVVYKICDGL